MQLYFSPGTCSLAPHIVLREAGLSPTLVQVDLPSHRTADGADFFATSPKGRVPVLELDDGTSAPAALPRRGGAAAGRARGDARRGAGGVMDQRPDSATDTAIRALLQDYFDGLHFSDAERLGRVFHPSAVYACATTGQLQRLDMAAYLPMVAQRPSPASLGQPRADQVVAIEMAGPVTALARVHCTIAPRRFTDLLTLVRLDGRWQVLAKVFHFEVTGAAPPTTGPAPSSP